jgi:hypothetical protein
MNALDLSEWVTFLPGVRDGALPFGRLSFLMPVLALAVLFGIAAGRPRAAQRTRRARWRALLPDSRLGWCLLALAVLCLGAVLPPYEAFVRPDWWSDYRGPFFAACAALLALGVVLVLPEEVTDVLQLLIAVVMGVYVLWLMLTLWRVVAFELLLVPWTIGYGWAAVLLGFLGLAVAGLSRVFGPRA